MDGLSAVHPYEVCSQLLTLAYGRVWLAYVYCGETSSRGAALA